MERKINLNSQNMLVNYLGNYSQRFSLSISIVLSVQNGKNPIYAPSYVRFKNPLPLMIK
jgi:hypothetical protein